MIKQNLKATEELKSEKGGAELAEVALPDSSSERGVRTISGKKGLKYGSEQEHLLALRTADGRAHSPMDRLLMAF